MENWIEGMDVAVTVCDATGVIIAMNGRAGKTFAKYGGKSLVGKNALDYHPEPARAKFVSLLENPRSNVYTIEKNGVKKIVCQSPWHDNGRFGGIVELSFELPAELPNHARKSG